MHPRLKTALSILLFVSIVLSYSSLMTHPAQSATFTDLDQCASFTRPAVEYLIEQGIIVGSNGRFNPRDILTRAQMVKMLVSSMGIDTSNSPAQPSFIDVAPSHWSYSYVEAALREGIIVMGSNRKFAPDDQTTREQMSAMFVRALGINSEQLLINQKLDSVSSLNDTAKISSWARDSVEFCLDNGLMVGVGGGNFAPSNKAERQQAALVIYRFIMARNALETVKEDFQKAVQHPEYYNAIKQALTKGRVHATLEMNLLGRGLGYNEDYFEIMVLNLDTLGEINGRNNRLDTYAYMFLADQGEYEMNYQIINLDGKTYFKENETTPWKLLTAQQLADKSLPVSVLSDFAPATSEFLRNYNNLPITKDTQVIDGKNFTRYSMTFNHLNYKNYGLNYIEGLVESNGETITDLYNNGFSLHYEVFLDESQVLHHERAGFTGKYIEEPTEMDLLTEINVEVSYTDLGQEITITAPLGP